MKQITLHPDSGAGGYAAGPPCAGRLALVWGAYGYAMTLLWWALPRGAATDAVAWAIAAACGLALAAWTREL